MTYTAALQYDFDEVKMLTGEQARQTKPRWLAQAAGFLS